MNIQTVRIEAIDAGCEDFRISETLAVPALVYSLKEVGQLNPVILLRRQDSFVIVCGFRRIHALRQLNRHEVWAQVLSPEVIQEPHPFLLALRDNLSHRQLDPLEKARVIARLHTLYEASPDPWMQRYFPLLGLPAHPAVLTGYLALHAIHPGLRRSLQEGSLTLSSIEFLAKLATDAQAAVAALMSRVRLSASLQKKVLGLMDDISGMNGDPFFMPLQSPEIQKILADAELSSFQKGEKVHEILYRIRNPRLSLAKEEFLERKNRLGLPGSIRLNPHPFFETNDIRVEFDVSSAARFCELAGKLHEAALSADLEGLFQIRERHDSV